MMVSKRKFDSLPANLQESLRAASHELTTDWRRTMVEKTDETSKFLKDKGLTINEVDRAAYRKQTDGVYKEFRDIIGGDLVDSVMKQVGSA
jgi:TRAP-type C4-dicarboxylate transport system substrate-binding protein